MQGQHAGVVGDVAQLDEPARGEPVGGDVADHRAGPGRGEPGVRRGGVVVGHAVVQYGRFDVLVERAPGVLAGLDAGVLASAPAERVGDEAVGVRLGAFGTDRGVRVDGLCGLHERSSGRRLPALWVGKSREPARAWGRRPLWRERGRSACAARKRAVSDSGRLCRRGASGRLCRLLRGEGRRRRIAPPGYPVAPPVRLLPFSPFRSPLPWCSSVPRRRPRGAVALGACVACSSAFRAAMNVSMSWAACSAVSGTMSSGWRSIARFGVRTDGGVVELI